MGAGQRLGPGGDAEPAEPFALGDHAGDRGACLGRCLGDRLEIDVGGQILLARVGEHRREAVAANRLQRVAGRRSWRGRNR